MDGGSTASVAAIIDGSTLVYAAVGDSCSLFGVPAPTRGGTPTTIELIPEHSPTNAQEWADRLHKTGNPTPIPNPIPTAIPNPIPNPIPHPIPHPIPTPIPTPYP